MGERILQNLLPDINVNSAGISGLIDHPADATAENVAGKHGIPLCGHMGRKVTAEMLHSANLILVMENDHLRHLTAIAPEIRGKTMLFARWLENKEIPDPYRKSIDVFEHVFCLLQQASHEWAKRLKK